jgi:hypothetical protein
MQPIQPKWHNEDQIEAMLRRWLKKHDWEVLDALARAEKMFVRSTQLARTGSWRLKGYPATFYKKDGLPKRPGTIRTQRRTWFVEALGQIEVAPSTQYTTR